MKETRKHFKSNLLLVVVLVLESKGLQYVVKSHEPEIKPAENICILKSFGESYLVQFSVGHKMPFFAVS